MNVQATDTDLAELDAQHRQIRDHLDRLAALASRVQSEDLGEEIRAEACAIEAFFSGVMRQHDRLEEAIVFPPLLDSGDAELVTAVRTLQQDHGWIEANLTELAPQMRAIAQGNHWVEPAEFLHNAEVFLELCYGHAALEDVLIGPQARARREAVQTPEPAQAAGTTP
jgi:iron-sulfur cluster repair protein YtfE (RIC family)